MLNTNIFLSIGHDTTATAAPWILYCLAKHPEYQHKVQEEIDSLLEDRDSDDILWFVNISLKPLKVLKWTKFMKIKE